MPLVDAFGRTIDYLRVSVTDRCNFRCVYCMPEQGITTSPAGSLLTFEEIERVLQIAASLGISKVRITGGEPLVRRELVSLIRAVAAIPGIQDLAMTTNGYLLARHAFELAEAGLHRVNVSLDTLRRDRFVRIARRGDLDTVTEGIARAMEAGLVPVKLNVVAMRGINDDEAVDFARLTLGRPINVRFIELMPINWAAGEEELTDFAWLVASNRLHRPIIPVATARTAGLEELEVPLASGMLDASQMRRLFIPAGEIRSRIEAEWGRLVPCAVPGNGPAYTYRIPGAEGTIGFISQISRDACRQCNRIRLTADGHLRPCLMTQGEINLRDRLRAGAPDDEIAALIRQTVLRKPLEHNLDKGATPLGRTMNQLGG
ncbi:MAG: GTP 3',8-cyclase MoaA [Chthonomonadales bacterium]